MTSDPKPQHQKSSKLPRRHWNATESFIDTRLSHWIQSFLAFALLTVAIVQALIYFTQAGIMRGQLAEMQEERRPWMQGGIQFVGPLVFDNDGARVPTTFLLRNTGHSPAKSVLRGMMIFPGDVADSIVMDQEDALCKSVARDTTKGFTIFPEDTSTLTLPLGIGAPEIINNTDFDGGIVFRIIMCIDYALWIFAGAPTNVLHLGT